MQKTDVIEKFDISSFFHHSQDGAFYLFFKWFWPVLEPSTPLADNWHVRYLCDELQKLGSQVLKREPLDKNLIINISPGETKSSISTVFFPVWCWANDPTLRIITASYSKDLANSHSQKSRDLIKSSLFQELYGSKFGLRKDMDAKSYYGNDKGGQRITASVGSTITGKHAHIIIVDDPLNQVQAKSDRERENANAWMTGALSTRKVDQDLTPTLLIMQRLHEEDCTEVMKKAWDRAGTLNHIRLPADDRYPISPPELVEKYTFDTDRKVMNPIRKPTRVINRMEEEMTAVEAAGQLGQDPKPAEGNRLKKAWFVNRFRLEDHTELVWNAVVDGAYTKKTTNSATGVIIFAIKNKRIYLRNFKKYFLEFPELCDQLPAFLRTNGVDLRGTVYVEAKAIGKSLVQTLRSLGGINIVENPLPEGVTQQQGKEMRVDNITPYVRGMNAELLEGVDWDAFISECAIFPNGSHDDLVDGLVMICEKVIKPREVNADLWLNL